MASQQIEIEWVRGVKITVRSDQEPSLIAFKEAVAVKRKSETAFIESAVRESKSNVLVERAIRNWRDQYRTLRHQLETWTKERVPRGEALSSLLVTWAADVKTNKGCKQTAAPLWKL